MIKNLAKLLLISFVFACGAAFATTPVIGIDELLTTTPDDTQCATRVFADALAANASAVSDTTPEEDVNIWAHKVFAQADVLNAVLACPEVASRNDTDTINFLPIQYVFPGGREINITYATQPKVLKQRLALAGKHGRGANPSLAIGDDTGAWASTDPAWYAIMVVQSGTLDNFVGADKNNTISLQYIYDNIDTLYPNGFTCTSKSALANDTYAINRATTATVGLKEATGESDSNDYYVAGDINLEWIAYAEIAAEIALTILTYGGGAVASGAAKSARASKILKNTSTSLRTVMKIDDVHDYAVTATRAAHIADELAKLDKVKDAAKYAEHVKELDTLHDTLKALEAGEHAADIAKYRELSKTYAEINAYRHALKGLKAVKAARRGNVLTRGWKALKAANSGTKMLNKGAKLARSGMKSGKLRDWLFHATMRNASKLARLEQATSLAYGVLKIGLDMYDYTAPSTDEYSSGVEMKPLLLLSADDLEGMENVVNYGMWLMWAGDSYSAADDDAAYLQAMDFAEKFHQELKTVQNNTASPCSVDIYVVHPIIHNPGDDDQELYYLIMNDTPWTTAN